MKDTLDHLAQSTDAIGIAKTATIAGGTTAFAFGLSAQTLIAVVGLLIAILGFAYNIWATERRLKILKSQHKDEGE